MPCLASYRQSPADAWPGVCSSSQASRCFPAEQQSLEASKVAKRPALQPLPNTSAADVSRPSRTTARKSVPNAVSRDQQRHAEQPAYATTTGPEVLGVAEKKLERETKPKPTALAPTLAIRTTASRIIDSVLERICQPGPALTPELNWGRRVAKPPTPRDGKGSCPAEDALPSTGPRLSRQPVPPAGPKPPAQTGAQRRSAHVKRFPEASPSCPCQKRGR